MKQDSKVNLSPKRSEEPIWWSLFGAGGTWFAMLTPITILVVGILIPLEIIELEALHFERVSAFAASFIGGAFIIASIALPMWHAMHRVHHGMHDLKFHTGTTGKVFCYGFAALMSVLAIVFIFML
ncbi:fumarate reductase subunit FrdD [Vibrio marisflavi]|uniref:Fumarate reductase subunit D n=1 Tax=Vibrio marisflavi CECT 7928 TaxID=634439 RepID=A0ABN8E9P0_9VIBR|nr:fumarate reductase subunit FrdD [Vibrio marisflavi]CAH0541703.1 Fumarate reductase subunit D [Vibrio marisflavi CECT 7928]